MKYHATPDFSRKLGALRPASLQRLSMLVKAVANADAARVLEDLSPFGVLSLESGIYVATAGSARVFFTFGGEVDTRYCLLLDILEFEPVAPIGLAPGRHSPVTDQRLNPNINTRINPYVNSRLNPSINSVINPFMNSRLNPIINSLLNPLINSRLNPLINTMLNPLINSRLNPFVNSTINPALNRSYPGPYLYDLGLKQVGFVVEASTDVILIFDEHNKKVALGTKNSIKGYTLFDNQNQWIGQLVPDGQGGYLRYDRNNHWIGIVV